MTGWLTKILGPPPRMAQTPPLLDDRLTKILGPPPRMA